MAPPVYKLIIITTFVFLTSSSSTSVPKVSPSEVKCKDHRDSVITYCEAVSVASKKLDEETRGCCFYLRMYNCVNEHHNETCLPTQGTIQRLSILSANCKQLTDFSTCNSFFDKVSPASVTFIAISTMLITMCICYCFCCRICYRNDANRDIISSSCQLTDFKVSSIKSDLKESSYHNSSSYRSLSPIKDLDVCPVSLDLSDQSNEKNNPQPNHQSLLDIAVEITPISPDEN